jgi:hypothetical protein
MCEPATIALIAIAIVAIASVASTTTVAVNAQKAAEAQNKVSKANARLKRQQTAQAQAQESEANAQKAFELARQAQVAKGAAKAKNLGERSVRAIGRSIGFQLGSDKATLQRNQEIAATTAAARLRGIDLTRTSEQIQIGDTSGVTMGLAIGTGVLSAAGGAVAGASNLGLGIPSTSTAPTTAGNVAAPAVGGPSAFSNANVA